MPTITCPAALVRQGSLKSYATSIKVGDLNLQNFYKINALDPENPVGAHCGESRRIEPMEGVPYADRRLDG